MQDKISKIEAINQELKSAILKHCKEEGNHSSVIPSLRLIRRTKPSEIRVLYTPIIGLTVQGQKRTVLGNKEYCYGKNTSLILGMDMPSLSHVLEASKEEPFLALSVDLDKNLLAELINLVPAVPVKTNNNLFSAVVVDADVKLMEVFLRLIDLLDNEEDIHVLAPLYIRELHYRILSGSLGSWLRSLCSLGLVHNQIARAVSYLRNNYQKPIVMEQLAQDIGMSSSSFFKHFKLITTYSPLQFQKTLRIYAAQKMILTKECDVATAAYSVGYESSTQFIREYKRMFGLPPYKDVYKNK